MISKAPAKYDLTAKLNHETKITLECVLFITRKEKQATFPQVQKLFVPCTSFKRSLTRFPSWLSKQTLCKVRFMWDRYEVYRVSQEFEKTRGPILFIDPIITKPLTIITCLIPNQLKTTISQAC